MKAFVQTVNGHFPEADYYLAWRGFDELGYEVVKFDQPDIGALEITGETPMAAGLQTCRTLIRERFGWDYSGANPYPDQLKEFFHRDIVQSRWGDVKAEVMNGRMNKFIKPAIEKQFTAAVATSARHSIRKSNIDDDDGVYLCEPVSFEAEFRVYVYDDEIVGIKHYRGSWYMHPGQAAVQKMIQHHRQIAPVAYGLDVGILMLRGELQTALVEVNDGLCLGNYGLEAKPYAQMIAARWLELIEKGNS
jgi:hypothetical protein